MSMHTPTGPSVPGGGSGARLRRDLIIETAAVHLDRHGAHGVTMRAVSRDLGVQAMSLYRYVKGRDELLQAVVLLQLRQLRVELASAEDDTWQGYLRAVAGGARRIAVEHPHAWGLLVTWSPAPPWLRPPLPSLGLVEDVLATLSVHGFSDEQVVDTYRALTSFLIGQLPATPPLDGPVDHDATSARSQLDLTDQPVIDRMRSLLRSDPTVDEFDDALHALLVRVRHHLTPRSGGPVPPSLER